MKPRNKFIDVISTIVIVVIVVTTLFVALWPLKVSGSSMSDTLNSGDEIIISRIMRYVTKIQSGDIYVCKVNINGEEQNIIKRVIGIPGDHIQINSGDVYINGEKLNEPYVKNGEKTSGEIDLTLGEDEYFVMGDNRAVSKDSRDFGPVNSSQISAKVILRIWPLNRITVFA